MNEIQNFSFNGSQIRTLTIDDKPHFVGKDVALVLGYNNPRDAVRKHVDEEDKGVHHMEREEKDTKVKTGNAASSDPAILWLEEHGFGAVIWRFFFAPISYTLKQSRSTRRKKEKTNE